MNQFSAGMIRLKHFGIQIEVHATAPIHYHVNISTFKLTFASQPNSLHVFAELSAAKVESCQHAKIETSGILFELFCIFKKCLNLKPMVEILQHLNNPSN
jgi:hypothetical protein